MTIIKINGTNILKNTEKKTLIKFVNSNVITKKLVKQMTPSISSSPISELRFTLF